MGGGGVGENDWCLQQSDEQFSAHEQHTCFKVDVCPVTQGCQTYFSFVCVGNPYRAGERCPPQPRVV